MRAALVRNGLVIAAVELAVDWDQPDAGRDAWTPPEGVQVIASNVAGIGWTWDGATFTAPPPNPDPPPPDLIDSVDLVQLKISFNHENRIRALEGKVALTLVQYKAVLRTLLA